MKTHVRFPTTSNASLTTAKSKKALLTCFLNWKLSPKASTLCSPIHPVLGMPWTLGSCCQQVLSFATNLKIAVKRRMGQAITPHHILAKMLSNKPGCSLSGSSKEEAMSYLQDIDESFPGILAAFQIQDTTVFPASAFIGSIRNILEPVKYWQYVMGNTELEPVINFCRLAIRVLSCPPSSAGVRKTN